MAVFAVFLDEEQPQVRERLIEAYPKPRHHQLADNLFLVRTDTIAQTIAESLGIKGDERDATGVVFKLNASYSGFADRAIWDWLTLTEQP